jgi:hypothetical protein
LRELIQILNTCVENMCAFAALFTHHDTQGRTTRRVQLNRILGIGPAFTAFEVANVTRD